MRSFLVTAFCVFLCSCSDPVEHRLRQEISSYPKFWTQSEQISQLRKEHEIPESYKSLSLKLIGAATSKDKDYGLYEWCFRFLKDQSDVIEVRKICYFDTDVDVMYEVKTERLHWKHSKIVDRKYSFRGVED